MKRFSFFLLVAIILVLGAGNAAAQSKTIILVKEFTTGPNVAWPYDMKRIQSQLVAELKAKLGDRYEFVTDLPAENKRVYVLEGQVTGWRPGNRAKRFLVGMGSGREAADIHFWVTDDKLAKVCEHKETVRAEFWGNEMASSVGELAHPFSDKIAKRLSESKSIIN